MKSVLKYTLFVVIAFNVVACSNNKPSKTITKSGEINVITASEFKTMSENQLIIDVRTLREFEGGHIENAINIDFFDKSFLTKMDDFDKNEAIFLYCKSGNRSSKASKQLSELGFSKVYDLHGGIRNWSRNNYEIIK